MSHSISFQPEAPTPAVPTIESINTKTTTALHTIPNLSHNPDNQTKKKKNTMAPKNNAKGGGDKKSKGAKDDDQGKASGKGAAAALKPATSINVRHILVCFNILHMRLYI